MIAKSVCDLEVPFLYFMTSLGFLALEDGTVRLSRNDGTELLYATYVVISKKSADLICIAAET